MSAAVNEYSPGSIVELHSLSKVELNGKIGECGKYDNTTGRQTVILLDTKKKLAVKCINLKRPALTSEELKQADAEVDDAISRLRQCQNGQGDQKLFDSVLTSLKDIIKRYPSCGKAHMIVGDALHMASVHPKDCLPHYRRAAENGGGSHARLSYSGMLGESGDLKGEIHHIELVLQEETSFTKLSIHARLNYGNSLTQVGDYKKAFKYFKIGNDLKKKNTKYNHNDFVKLINNIKSFFQNTEIHNHKKKISDKKAVFICGMPRSGTTLLEQIISSHKDVIATGENNFVSSFINENYLNNFSLSYKKIIKDIYAKENLPQNYVLKLLDEYNFNSKVFTDKSVENFLWIGFIRIFFPNSKIILTERNAKDVCFSLYKINFKSQFMNFTYNQKDISNFYNSYIELVEFWKKLFLSDIYIAKYEKLVDEPETEIKKLINFCDLDWDSNCLQHYKNKSTIKTASINQARKPIYKSSKNISDNYSDYFEEMFGLLKI